MNGLLLPIAAVIAVIILIAGHATRLRAAGGWLALLILGQAASIRWITAGPSVRYQHYLPWDALAQDPLAVIVIVAEALLVSIALVRTRDRWMAQARRLGRVRLAALGAILFVASAVPSPEGGRYLGELVLAFGLALMHLGAIGLAACAIPDDRLRALSRRSGGWLGISAEPDGLPRLDRFVWLTAALVTVLSAGLGTVVYETHPHLPDEVVYLTHARYFAEGMLDVPAAPVPEAFEIDLISYEAERWYSPVPPGWPAILAVGAKLGLPWLVNPLLAGLGILLTYLLVWELYDRRAARGAIFLLALSPWYLFMAMSLMTHTAGLVAAVAAGWTAARWRRTGGLGWIALAGAFMGVVSLIRPLEAVAVGLIILVGLVAAVGVRRCLRPVIVLGVASMAVAAIVLPYNARFTGSPTKFPLMAYTDAKYGEGVNDLGFGPDRGMDWPLDPFPGHGPADVVVNNILNTAATNTELFGWATGSLLAVFALVAFGRIRGADRLLVVFVLIVLGLHSLYWYSGGPDFGARYWFLIIVPLAALTARFVDTAETGRARLGLAVAGLTLASVVCFTPWRAVDKYHEYRGMRPDIRRIADREGFENVLVLVRGSPTDYAGAAVYNPLDLSADAPLYAWDRDPGVRDALRAAFPDRLIWVLEGPSVTGRGYRIVERPHPVTP